LISCFRTLELANSIDSTENLANSKVFLVHGADDTVVDPLFAKLIEAYYEGFNVDMNAKAEYIEQTVRP
jgi:predicted esterase